MSRKIKLLWRRWMTFGKKVAAFQIKVLCTLVYVILIVPLGLFLRMFLSFPEAGWQKLETKKSTPEEAKRQF